MAKDRWFEGHAQRRVADLKVDDRVDLENDKFADPQGFKGLESDAAMTNGWDCEFATVRAIEHESKICVRVDFDNFSCGFPPYHWVDVDGEQVREG